MPASPLLSRSSNKAVALIIVLAFVVLLTGLSLAYLSRTTSERQLAHSSYNDTSADLLARSALDIIVSDLKREIVNGSSTVTPTPGTTIYVPTPAANIVPSAAVQRQRPFQILFDGASARMRFPSRPCQAGHRP